MPDGSSSTVFALLLSVALVGSVAVVGVGFGQQTDASNETASNETDADTERELVTQTTSYLRIAHAAPGAGAVDVYVDNQSVATGVPFGAVSDYMALESGTHTVTVTVVGVRDAVVFNETVDLEPRSVTTVTASVDADGENGAVVPVAYADDARTPAANESALRIVHLSPNAPRSTSSPSVTERQTRLTTKLKPTPRPARKPRQRWSSPSTSGTRRRPTT